MGIEAPSTGLPSRSAKLLDVALERERLVPLQAAETEATRRADLAKTALLHAISHDLRSPLTAITTAAGGLRRRGSVDRRSRRAALGDPMSSPPAFRGSSTICWICHGSRRERSIPTRTGAICATPWLVRLPTCVTYHGDHPIEFHLASASATCPPADAVSARACVHEPDRERDQVLASRRGGALSGGVVVGERVVVRVVDRGAGHPRARSAPASSSLSPRGRDASGGSPGLGLAICPRLRRGQRRAHRASDRDRRGDVVAVSFPLVPPAGAGMSQRAPRPRRRRREPDPARIEGGPAHGGLRSGRRPPPRGGTRRRGRFERQTRRARSRATGRQRRGGMRSEVRAWSRLPIVVLSALGDEREKVRALDAGADDDITKPFGTEELLARLRAVLPRRSTDEDGEARVDRRRSRGRHGQAREVRRGSEQVHLTPLEFDIVPPARARPKSRQARDAAAAAAGGVGPGIRDRDALPARPRRAHPREDRARRLRYPRATSTPSRGSATDSGTTHDGRVHAPSTLWISRSITLMPTNGTMSPPRP